MHCEEATFRLGEKELTVLYANRTGFSVGEQEVHVLVHSGSYEGIDAEMKLKFNIKGTPVHRKVNSHVEDQQLMLNSDDELSETEEERKERLEHGVEHEEHDGQ